MSDIIYLHGFASSNKTEKVLDLKKVFGASIIAPDLLSKPVIDVKHIDNIIKRYNDPVLVGSSLGGFYVEYFSCKYQLRSLLINPLLDITLIEPYIGEHDYYYSQEKFHFTIEDYNYLLSMEKELSSLHPSSNKTVILAKNDSVIPSSVTLKYYENSNIELNIFENESHSFLNIDVLVENIRKITK